MSFSEKDYIWADDNLKCIWQDASGRFYTKRIVFKPKNYIIIDLRHEQYLMFLADDDDDAISVAKVLANALYGR